MRHSIKWTIVAATLAPVSALADDRAAITQIEQQLVDAIAAGDVAVWDRYLDANIIYAEEDGSYKGKPEALHEIVPLPKGLSGIIRVDLLSYHQDGDIAVALFRQNEIEHYFGQTLHASYLTNTTWARHADGWKQIEGQVIAERTDPPSIALPPERLNEYAGTYKLKDSEATYTLTVADGVVTGTRNGRKPAAWKAEVQDVFFVPGDPRIRKIFQRDAQGRVTGFVERRETWDIVWEKM